MHAFVSTGTCGLECYVREDRAACPSVNGLLGRIVIAVGLKCRNSPLKDVQWKLQCYKNCKGTGLGVEYRNLPDESSFAIF